MKDENDGDNMKIRAKLAKDYGDFAWGNVNGDTALVKHTWYYIVYSFQMKDGKDTEVLLFLNNAVDNSTKTLSNRFIVDDGAYKSFIGLARKAVDDNTEHLKGFIYSICIYQTFHTAANVTHYNGGCKA
jgi:hypothetical protein